MFKYKPHKYQQKIEDLVNDGFYHTIAGFAGRRGGKTVVFAKKVVEWMDRGRTVCCGTLPEVVKDDDGTWFRCPTCGRELAPKDTTDVDILVVAPTYTDLNDVHIATIKKMIPVHIWDKYWNEQKKMLTIPLIKRGNYIIKANRLYFRSADKPEKIGRGMSYDVIWMDEIRFFRSLALLISSLRPTLVDRKGFLYVSTTTNGKDDAWKQFYLPASFKISPKEPLQLKASPPKVYKRRKLKGVDTDLALVTWRTVDNPYVPDEMVKKDRERMQEWYWRQEYFATVEGGIGLVYPDFSEKTHVEQPQVFNDGVRTFIGIDVGWNHPTAVTFIVKDHSGIFHIIGEIYKQHLTPQQIADEIIVAKKKLGKYFDSGVMPEPVFVAIDPASKQSRQSAQGRSVYDQLLEVGVTAELSNNDRMAGINLVTSVLMKKFTDGTDEQKGLMVFDTCEHTITEFQTHRWKVNSEGEPTDEVDKRNDDLMDAIRYVFMLRPEDIGLLVKRNNQWVEDTEEGTSLLGIPEEWVEV